MQVFAHASTRRFLYGFWAMRQRMVRHTGPSLKMHHGLDIGEFFLLDLIARRPFSPTEIARHLELPAHAISKKLDALETQDLIVRSIDPRDARRHELSLTAPGRKRLAEAAITMERETEAFLCALSPEALNSFLDALEDLAEDRPS